MVSSILHGLHSVGMWQEFITGKLHVTTTANIRTQIKQHQRKCLTSRLHLIKYFSFVPDISRNKMPGCQFATSFLHFFPLFQWWLSFSPPSSFLLLTSLSTSIHSLISLPSQILFYLCPSISHCFFLLMPPVHSLFHLLPAPLLLQYCYPLTALILHFS